ncbi:MAG: hypothetical protein LBH03_01650 [Holophagales bacterium]|nr:hypothetical protein [Holophagales bacterium]
MVIVNGLQNWNKLNLWTGSGACLFLLFVKGVGYNPQVIAIGYGLFGIVFRLFRFVLWYAVCIEMRLRLHLVKLNIIHVKRRIRQHS